MPSWVPLKRNGTLRGVGCILKEQHFNQPIDSSHFVIQHVSFFFLSPRVHQNSKGVQLTNHCEAAFGLRMAAGLYFTAAVLT